MIDGILAGRIFGTPLRRTSKNGHPFVTARMRVAIASSDAPAFVNLVTFRESVGKALLALDDGTSIAVAGELKIGTYTSRKDGLVKPSIDITVHEILTAHHVARRRKAAKGEPDDAPRPIPRQSDIDDAPTPKPASPADFEDDIPAF